MKGFFACTAYLSLVAYAVPAMSSDLRFDCNGSSFSSSCRMSGSQRFDMDYSDRRRLERIIERKVEDEISSNPSLGKGGGDTIYFRNNSGRFRVDVEQD